MNTKYKKKMDQKWMLTRGIKTLLKVGDKLISGKIGKRKKGLSGKYKIEFKDKNTIKILEENGLMKTRIIGKITLGYMTKKGAEVYRKNKSRNFYAKI